MPSPKRYPPTPWISQVNPVTQEHYKFRIFRTRLNGQFTIETAKDSPTSPGETRYVKPSRVGWWPFVQACSKLLDLAQWDPDTNPDSPAARTMWNKNKQDYAVMGIEVDVIVALLPQLITGASRASIRKTLQTSLLASTANTTDPRHVASRTNRYAEITRAVHQTLTILDPLHERMQDARRMKGYNQNEVQGMAGALATALQALKTVQRIARIGNQAHNPIYKKQPQGDLKSPLADAVFDAGTIDDFETELTPLSPSEQQIAATQTRNEPPMYHPGTNWLTPEYQRYTGWSETDIAASQAAGRARGIIKDVEWGDVKAAMNAGKREPKGFAITPEDSDGTN